MDDDDTQKPPKRQPNGRYLKGESGNPRGGSLPKVQGLREFREKNSMEVMQFLLNFMRDEKRSDMSRVVAAKELNDRMHGKSVQAQVNMDIDGSVSGDDWSGLSGMLAQAQKSALLQRAKRVESERKNARAAAQTIEPEPTYEPPPYEPQPQPAHNTRASPVEVCAPQPEPPPTPKYRIIPGTAKIRRVS
jgi:hypothetical protein